jgi:hypothetical protein
MNRVALRILATAAFCVLLFSSLALSQIRGRPAVERSALPSSYRIHGEDLLRKQELAVRKYISEHPEALKSSGLRKTWNFNVDDRHSWYADDFTKDSRYLVPSTCRAVGINCYVFVEDGSWNNGLVDQFAVDSIRIYFDSKTPANASKGIFETDTAAFGTPPDVDGDPKIIILLLDIKDGYDPNAHSGSVEGYFYSFNEVNPSQPGYATSNFAEMFFIDTYPLDLRSEGGLFDGISTLAHEFQHMIHFNYDRNEITFVNEGCSLVAEVNCGFPIYNQSRYVNQTNQYLFTWHYDDMTAVLSDYSRAARFFVYVRDQIGMGVFKKIVASTLHGVDGINAALQAFGSDMRFGDILPNWFIANVLDDRSIDPKYGYVYPGLPKASGLNYYSPNVSLRTDSVQNYAVEYFTFKKGSQLKTTITTSTSSLGIKAVEIGSSSKILRDVASGVEFSEPQFDSTYSEIHFIVMNTSPDSVLTYSYEASGTSTEAELKYDLTEPTGYLAHPAGDTVCVWFDAVAGGRLDSIRIALRRKGTMTGGVWTYTGAIRPSPLGAPLAVPIYATVDSTVDYSGDPRHPYPVPWPNWAVIDLRSMSISTANPFAVAFVCSGEATTQPRVMITESPAPANATSLTYMAEQQPANWYSLVTNNDGDSVYTYLIRAYVSFGTVGVKSDAELVPGRYELRQNYPNPFNPGTTIEFILPKESNVTLKIYDLLGREVATLVDGKLPASTTPYSISFDASHFSSGVYFYQIVAGSFTETKKLIVLK